MAWTTPRTWIDGELVTEAYMDTDVAGNIGFLYEQHATRAAVWLISARALGSTVLAHAPSTSERYNINTYNSSNSDGDSFSLSIVLAAGTYTMYVLGTTGGASGLIDWTLGGSSIATGQDWYTAATTYNVLKTISSLEVNVGGRLVLTGEINGKNASSAGHYFNLSGIWFKQATDSG